MNSDPPITSVLFIDASKDQRTYWGDQLKRCSADYEIVEASDGESGLDIFRSGGSIASCLNSQYLINRAWPY